MHSLLEGSQIAHDHGKISIDFAPRKVGKLSVFLSQIFPGKLKLLIGYFMRKPFKK